MYYICNAMDREKKTEAKKRKTEVKSIAINDYLLEKSNKLVEDDKFGSLSDVIITALTEFHVRYGIEHEHTAAIDILFKMLQTPEGKKAFDIVQYTTHTQNEEADAKPDQSKNNRVPTPDEQRKAKENHRALDERLAKEHNTTPLYQIDELAAKIRPVSTELKDNKVPDMFVRRVIMD